MISNLSRRQDLHQSVLVSVRGPHALFGKNQEKDALGVVEWHMPAGESPPGYSISIANNSGMRDMISKSGNFVVNFMGKEHGPQLALFSRADGALSDLYLLMGFNKSPSEQVESPTVAEAKATLECEVIHEMASGDHTVFVGRIMHAKER